MPDEMCTGEPPCQTEGGRRASATLSSKRRGGLRGAGVTHCKVKPAEDERPAVCVPRPARNRAVNDRQPAKRKGQHRAQPAALGETTHGEDGGDACKHALVKHVKRRREAGRPDRGLLGDISEGKVAEVADEG